MNDLYLAMAASGLLQDLLADGCEPTEIQDFMDYAYLTAVKPLEELL